MYLHMYVHIYIDVHHMYACLYMSVFVWMCEQVWVYEFVLYSPFGQEI